MVVKKSANSGWVQTVWIVLLLTLLLFVASYFFSFLIYHYHLFNTSKNTQHMRIGIIKNYINHKLINAGGYVFFCWGIKLGICFITFF